MQVETDATTPDKQQVYTRALSTDEDLREEFHQTSCPPLLPALVHAPWAQLLKSI